MRSMLYKRLIRPVQFWLWLRVTIDLAPWYRRDAPRRWALCRWLSQRIVPVWEEHEL